MTYATIADITDSPALFRRVKACAAQQGVDKPFQVWTAEHIWELAALPGWADKWASAQANPDLEGQDYGANEGVITDGDILAGVQHIIEQEASNG